MAHLLLTGTIVHVNNVKEEIWALEHLLHRFCQGELRQTGYVAVDKDVPDPDRGDTISTSSGLAVFPSDCEA
jgi:hypothetical protein